MDVLIEVSTDDEAGPPGPPSAEVILFVNDTDTPIVNDTGDSLIFKTAP